jgi:hypothetical protein
MESQLISRIYTPAPVVSIRYPSHRTQTVPMTWAAAYSTFTRKLCGQFDGPNDFALESLPATSFAMWLMLNAVEIQEESL